MLLKLHHGDDGQDKAVITEILSWKSSAVIRKMAYFIERDRLE